MAGVYAIWDSASSYGQRLHHIQAVDMLFTDIVTTRATAPAQLRALGLPVSWARYAGHYYWARTSVRQSPLYPRYAGQLTDGNITHYLLAHPASIVSVGQSAAIAAQRFRITSPGRLPRVRRAPERRVRVTGRRRDLADEPAPAGPGSLVAVPLWLVMTAVAVVALGWGRTRAWHRDGAVVVLCMIGAPSWRSSPPPTTPASPPPGTWWG